MSVFNTIQGTSLTTWRIGLTGPTVYSGSADPTISPPTPLADGFRDGDLYIRASAGASTLWVRDGGTFSAVTTGATGGDFDSDVTMGAGAQLLLDESANAAAPALTFDGDPDTGIFQNNPNEISFSTGGIEKFIIESDGTLASTTATYESLVVADNDIPNRKYVEDTFLNSAGDSITGNMTFIGTSRLLAADGSVALPSIGFGNDLDTGFMLDTGLGTNSIGVVSGGNLVSDFTPDGLQMRNSAQVIGDTGSALVPSFSFTGDLNTGIFSDGTIDQFGFSTGGTQRWLMNASGHFVPGAAATYDIGSSSSPVRNLYVDHTRAEFGAQGDPSFSFDGDTDTGMYRSAVNEISFSTNAVQRWSISAAGHFLPAVASTYDIGSQILPARDVYTTHVYTEIGSAALPAFSFDGDTDTGMYRALSNRIGFSTGGVQRVLIDDTFFDVNVPVRARTADTAAIPSYSWDGDIDTGLFQSAANTIGFSAGGTERATISTTALTSTVSILAPTGSAAVPSYSFASDPDTGFYKGGFHLDVSMNGTNTWRFSSNNNFIGVSTGSNTIQAVDTTIPGSISVRGGISTGGGNDGGTAFISGGTANVAGTGGKVTIRGGQGGTSGIGGLTDIVGGPGGSTSGDGGDVNVTGGQAAALSVSDAGDVVIKGGTAFGTGTDGLVRIASEMKLVVSTKASLPGSLGAAGAPEAGLLQFVTDDAGATAFVLAYSDSGPTWKRIDDNTNIA